MNSSASPKAQVWAKVLYRAAHLKQNGGLFVIRPAAESCGLDSADDEELRRWLQSLVSVIPSYIYGAGFLSSVECATYYLLLHDALLAGDLPTDPGQLDTDIVQEFDPTGRHRLVNARTGKCTNYADYRGFTYMDGVVGWTAYYGVSGGIGSPEDFMKLAAVSVAEEKGTDNASD